MLCKRIIPTLLVRGRTLVKGERYNSWRSIGHALQAAKVHAMRGADEICILDIAATAEGRGPDLDMVRELSEGCFIPITVGGGVRSLKDIDDLLRAGADKTAICTAAFDRVDSGHFIREASARFGSQAIVVSIDYKDVDAWSNCGKTRHGSVMQHSKWMQNCGAGELLLSDIERDGTMQGYDLELIRQVSQAVDIPVIASGGCSGYENMLEAFQAGADACAVGALFAFTDATPKGAAKYLKEHGLEIRV